MKSNFPHSKGVKTIDVSDEYIVTGSYDFTVKIWNKTSDITECTLFHIIDVFNDSIWDLKLKNHTIVTGGLDGIIGIFNIENKHFQVRHLFKVLSYFNMNSL